VRNLGEVFTEALDGFFGGQGAFTKIVQQGSVGLAAGQLAFGSKNSGLGSMIGGALGGALGENVIGPAVSKAVAGGLGKALGSAAGPLGAIAGGLLGGVLGSVFSSPKWATAVASNGNASAAGNQGEWKGAALQGATGINSTINKIAAQLGGSVGQYNVSIGLNDGNWHVSTTGRSGRLRGNQGWADVTDYGKDQEAAIRAALGDAIRDGAIQGISASKQAILRAGPEIEVQLDRVLQFQNVFDELRSKTDPLGYALQQISTQFDQMRGIFAEAGATAGEYAQLEQLLAMKRQDAYDAENARQLEKLNARRDLEVRLMEAQGNAAGALALSREIELSQTEASLRDLMRQVYAAEDAAQASDEMRNSLTGTADRFRQFAQELRDFRDGLLVDDTSAAAAYRAAQVKWMTTSALAATGNETALGNLSGAGRDFLDASRNRAGSALQYQRDLAMVLRGVDTAIAVSDDTVDIAQAQLDGILAIDATLAQIQAVLTGTIPAAPNLPAAIDGSGEAASLREQLAAINAKMEAVVANTERTATSTTTTARAVTGVIEDQAIRTRVAA
jgi:hypothetical protein